MITRASENGAPILCDPFTHEEVDEYYEQMYKHVLGDSQKLDLETLQIVHNFLEFEQHSTMMLDAWLHAQIQKLMGLSYSVPTIKEEAKA